jgi:hypothetical protein
MKKTKEKDSHCAQESSDFKALCTAAQEQASSPNNPQPNREVTIEDCEVLCTMICQKQCAENPSG